MIAEYMAGCPSIATNEYKPFGSSNICRLLWFHSNNTSKHKCVEFASSQSRGGHFRISISNSLHLSFKCQPKITANCVLTRGSFNDQNTEFSSPGSSFDWRSTLSHLLSFFMKEILLPIPFAFTANWQLYLTMS